jgi:hypothetical protein
VADKINIRVAWFERLIAFVGWEGRAAEEMSNAELVGTVLRGAVSEVRASFQMF